MYARTRPHRTKDPPAGPSYTAGGVELRSKTAEGLRNAKAFRNGLEIRVTQSHQPGVSRSPWAGDSHLKPLHRPDSSETRGFGSTLPVARPARFPARARLVCGMSEQAEPTSPFHRPEVRSSAGFPVWDDLHTIRRTAGLPKPAASCIGLLKAYRRIRSASPGSTSPARRRTLPRKRQPGFRPTIGSFYVRVPLHSCECRDPRSAPFTDQARMYAGKSLPQVVDKTVQDRCGM